MIAIVNITNPAKPTGTHRYSLRINRKVITEFDHEREDGLAVCLNKAAKAAEKARNEEVLQIIKEFCGENNEHR